MPATASPAVDSGAAVRPRWGLGTAAIGILLALVALFGYERLLGASALAYGWRVVLDYGVIWVPLVAVLLWACFARGSHSFAVDFGLRFHWIDLAWGLGVGVVMRAVAILVEIAVYGHPAGGLVLSPGVRDGWWWYAAVIAPVLIGPIVEELYFRGLVQRAVARAAASAWIGVVVSALVFGLLHTTDATSPQSAVVIGVSTCLFGAAAGTVTVLTGRLGGAIIAHIVFNAIAVILLGG